MALILISYDKTKDHQYTALHNAIEAYGVWWHCLDSTWMIVTTATATQVRDNLVKYLDNDDELLVADISGQEKAWYGFGEECSQWIKNHHFG